MQKGEVGPHGTHGVSSKCAIDSNVSSRTLNFLGKNRSGCYWPWVRQWPLRCDTKSTRKEEKIDKLDFIKIKNFRSLKDSIKKVKRHCTEWEKIFADRIPKRGLVSTIHETLFQLNNERAGTRVQMYEGSEQASRGHADAR